MYFESWFISQPLGFLQVPLPGGQLLMLALAINLLFGGLFRIRKTWNTAGIIIVHIGIVLLLLASLVKHRFADDGRLTLYEGESSSEFVHYHDWEVAITELGTSEEVTEYLIPHKDLVKLGDKEGRRALLSDLPLELTLRNFVPNARVRPAPSAGRTALPVVDGFTVVPQAVLVANEQNQAALYASALDRQSGRVEDGILFGGDFRPWTFEAGGKLWAIQLRHKRFTMPFEIKLIDFQKKDHARTNMPAAFSSDVLRIEDEDATPVHISMNEPLRHAGIILFQSGWGPQGGDPRARLFSTFSVVRNPSDQWPLISCIIIGLGMAFAFIMRLFRYIKSQVKARQNELAREGI